MKGRTANPKSHHFPEKNKKSGLIKIEIRIKVKTKNGTNRTSDPRATDSSGPDSNWMKKALRLPITTTKMTKNVKNSCWNGTLGSSKGGPSISSANNPSTTAINK